MNKIKYRGVFIERQLTGGGNLYVTHTGILYFLPEKFETMDAAKVAIDKKLNESKAYGS